MSYTCNIKIMYTALAAAILYLGIYGLEWLLEKVKKARIKYVSWETVLLFGLGITLIFNTFPETVKVAEIYSFTELFAGSILLFGLLLVAFLFHVEHERICTIGGRVEQCMSEAFVIIKGIEIHFQQLVYLVVAVHLPTFAFAILQYLLFLGIVFMVHLPVLLRVNRATSTYFAWGSLLISVPIYYIHTEIGQFWPAIYIHTLLYVFYWLVFSNIGFGDNSVDRGIKDNTAK